MLRMLQQPVIMIPLIPRFGRLEIAPGDTAVLLACRKSKTSRGVV
jgi:hypothetical protein